MPEIPHQVMPYQRTGAWISDWHWYFSTAKRQLREIEQRFASIESQEKEHMRSWEGDKDDGLAAFHHENQEEILALRSLERSTEIYAYFSVEAFLNNYGVKRLGEVWYKTFYERLNIPNKIAALVATCDRILLPKDHELIKLVRSMFDRRNQIVHPKAKEVTPDKIQEIQRQLIDNPAKVAAEKMDRFYELFGGINPEVKIEIELASSRLNR